MMLWYIIDRNNRRVLDIFKYPQKGRPKYVSGTWMKAAQFYADKHGIEIIVTANKLNIKP